MNKVVHFEIPYDDKEKCREFYEKVFGWEFVDMPEMDYLIARTVEVDEKQMPKESGAINGGMYKRGEEGAKSPVIVIDVISVEAHIKKIEGAGGSVVMGKRKVGEMGYYAQVKDTEGNVVGIWENITKKEGEVEGIGDNSEPEIEVESE
jgi:uncharacterized protein